MDKANSARNTEEIPFFSIIVPIYNIDAGYLDQCINSILEQSFPGIEVILVDDGSRKDCADACDTYAAKDDRVRVIHQQNQGVSAARNTGIEAASAEWIMFVDADDWLEKDACETVRDCLRDTDCEILMFSGTVESSGQQKKLSYGLKEGTVYDAEDPEIREMLYRRVMGVQNLKEGRYSVLYYSWDKVYRRDFLMDNGIRYPVGIPKSEDKVFILLCFEKLGRLFYVGNALYHYRINDSSACHHYSGKADTDRIGLSGILIEIADRMDKELSVLKGDPSFRGITDECNRFIFGITTDVIRLKYFHPDNPQDEKTRNREAKAFLRTEPFRSAIRSVKYDELPFNAKVKKFMLSHGMVSLFYRFKISRTAKSITDKQNQ